MNRRQIYLRQSGSGLATMEDAGILEGSGLARRAPNKPLGIFRV